MMGTPRRRSRRIGIVLALCGLLPGCDRTTTSAAKPVILRVGVLPDQSEQQLRQVHEPLLSYLEASTGLKLELIIPATYTELVERFADRDLQLAWFGGLTFLQAESRAGAEPLVMRDVDLEFTSDFLVVASAAERSVKDFVGGSLGFGPRLSTSGHLMPRHFLRQIGIEADRDFGSVEYSAGHDQTAEWVRTGRVDLGAVNSQVVESLFRQGLLTDEHVRVIWRTPPYRNYVWAAPPELDSFVRASLLDAFLSLEMAIPDHAVILERHGTQGFVPASSADYEELRSAAEILDELPGAGADP